MSDLRPELVGNIVGEFFVPSYQRGYRWGRDEVTHLLDDIRESAGNKYFLQPVVVKRRNDEKWELVDGQQRLTTLFLILRYIQRHLPTASLKYSLEYETRPSSAEYCSIRQLRTARPTSISSTSTVLLSASMSGSTGRATQRSRPSISTSTSRSRSMSSGTRLRLRSSQRRCSRDSTSDVSPSLTPNLSKPSSWRAAARLSGIARLPRSGMASNVTCASRRCGPSLVGSPRPRRRTSPFCSTLSLACRRPARGRCSTPSRRCGR